MLSGFHLLGGSSKLLLNDKQRFPDSSFSASTSSENHSASNARASSGSSWCAPDVDEKNYLQVDLGTLYRLDSLVTYGDSTSRKWVVTYKLQYTIDLRNWNTFSEVRKKHDFRSKSTKECFRCRPRIKIINLSAAQVNCHNANLIKDCKIVMHYTFYNWKQSINFKTQRNKPLRYS